MATGSPTEQAAAELPRAYFEKITSTHDSIDKVQQSITVALQQIDKNFSDCYKCALSLYQELAQYHALQLETRKALETWSPLFSAAAASSVSNTNASASTSFDELFLSSIGASPLRQEAMEYAGKNDFETFNPQLGGILIDPVTPKANTLLFHYLRRASLANNQQLGDVNINESDAHQQIEDCSSSSMSPPSLSFTPSSSLAPPSLSALLSEDSSITIPQDTSQNHSILMDFSPKIRKSLVSSIGTSSFNTSSPSSPVISLPSAKTPKTPPNKTHDPDPSLTLSMERLSVRHGLQDDQEPYSPKVLQFDQYRQENSNDADQQSPVEDDEESPNTHEFSLDRFPIVFQV